MLFRLQTMTMENNNSPVTAKKILEVLEKSGTRISQQEAEIILALLKTFAEIAIKTYLKYES